MSDADREKADQFAETREMKGTYRCVCGELMPLAPGFDTCPTCGRQYDSEVLRDAAADTALLPATPDSEHPTTIPGAAEGEDPFLGRQLGHYQILSRLGGGGMGSVYRALDQSLQRYVALKVIRHTPAKDADEAGVQQLLQEARAQARVNHPHVAHIYYVGSEDGTPFLAMELVGTHTLAHRLKYGALSFPEAARFALQIAQALAHAAKFDIVHGDVKPGNILFVDHKTVKITDFGLARRISELSGTRRETAGTPKYLAPEALAGMPTDHRSDMYSLGVTLFEMTFGRLPYTPRRGDLRELLQLHREAPVEYPEPWPADIPHAWRYVLEKLLAKRPEDRYPAFEDLIADLLRLQPVALPAARPFLRLLAWLFDGFLLSSPIVILNFALAGESRMVDHIAGALAGGLLPLGICYLQAWWGTTPGKRLLQIRIVDQHGLSPGKSTLALRAVFQFLWVWNLAASGLAQRLGLINLAAAVSLLVLVFILMEMAFVLLGKGRSLHDRFFGTRVVLDAAGGNRA